VKIYRPTALALTGTFAAVGLIFLIIPGRVLDFFNYFSPSLNLPQTPSAGFTFYLILAVGYMYVVTLLAFLMYRNPGNRVFPLLLAQAKLVSSLLSLALFCLQDHYLVYLANFLVDGFIGIFVAVLYYKAGRTSWEYS
jgi:hypothetical protein